MPRYIDAERFKLWLQENYVMYDGDRYFNDIDAQPTADVVRREKGRWIDMDNHVMCSCCGAAHYGVDKNFCPNCGAKMDLD